LGSAKVPASRLATASVNCKTSATIGVAYPATGDAASIGKFQWDWAQYAAAQWNKSHPMKITLQQGDTHLGTNDLAVNVAHSFASTGAILAVTGPAGSQEVQDSIGVYKSAGLVAVSGSATRVVLTRTNAAFGGARETPVGYFFRTVPNDGVQGDKAAAWIKTKIKAKKVYIINDKESYSIGLQSVMVSDLKKLGYAKSAVKTNSVSQSESDFSSYVTSIMAFKPQVVYLPWQLANKAQLIYNQLHVAGYTGVVFGSDGTDAPGTFQPNGHGYVTGFPVDLSNAALAKFASAHGGDTETFGTPTYTSVLVNATAIQAACKAGGGKTTRAAVRKAVAKVSLTKGQSLLGFPVTFLAANSKTAITAGAGDLGGSATFNVFQIKSNGNYVKVG
jgi:branched-chain amino acid transport system substrate-binding protein